MPDFTFGGARWIQSLQICSNFKPASLTGGQSVGISPSEQNQTSTLDGEIAPDAIIPLFKSQVSRKLA
jgi:hypothetical protein